MKVLIVEDEVLVRKGLVMGIDWESIGFENVYEAGNGIEALEQLKQHRIDLILTDIIMPGMNGLELINIASQHYPAVSIVVLSCVNDVESVREAMKHNRALDFIPKLSISPSALKENIQLLMQLKNVPSNQENMASKVYYFLEDEKVLQTAIKTNNQRVYKETISEIFSRIEGDSGFNDWIDIYALLNRRLKMNDLYMSDLTIQGQSIYHYLETASGLEDLEQRLIIAGLDVMNKIEVSMRHRYGKEMSKAVRYINEHLSENIKLKDLAGHVGMNESYLSSLFKQTIGVNFSDYVNQQRIESAKKLIAESDKSMYEIAHEVGYSSESYFSRIFKQIEGISPAKFKKK